MKTTPLTLVHASSARQAHAQASLARVSAAAPEILEELREISGDDADAALSCSDYLCDVIVQQPAVIATALERGALTSPVAPAIDDLAPHEPEDDLRRQRHREMFTIAWHDLTGARQTRDTLRALSDLADVLIQEACSRALTADADRYGEALAPPLIVAMGKLGGGELNFSSDVDLVFLHPDGSEEQRYLKLARDIVRWLDAPMATGRVHRVDVRLRPFGRTGALSLSLGAFERYLQTHARDWERYAYVKARVLTGNASDVEQLDALISAFVYRRYLDFGVFDALRDTKALIEAEVARSDRAQDLKRGAGGIREVEFITQAFQLLRGGRWRALQTPSLHEALSALDATERVTNVDVPTLLAAYDALRHVENRVQMLANRQVHSVPDDAVDLERVAAAMGQSVPSFSNALAGHRARVRASFERVLVPEPSDDDCDQLRPLWQAAPDRETLDALVAARYPETGEGFAEALHTLASSRTLSRLDRESRDRLDRLVPALVAAAMGTERPARTLERLTRVLEGVGRRSAYFSLLNERPQARQRLVDLCAASQRIASDVAEHPLLLDSLIGLNIDDLPAPAARSAQLADALHGVAADDLDALTDALAQFKGGAQFEVAVVDLAQQLPVMKVSDQLTAIAQSVLARVLEAAWYDIHRRYGRLPDPGGEFLVVAYGKLGGIELGYGSDLDLVFLYDGPQGESDGERRLETGMYFARLVQRVVSLATATTRAGVLYDVDMRLRPSGNSGPLVSRLSAYANYQQSRAWTWEHQALLRARTVAGDAALGERFGQLRRDVLCQPRDPDALRGDVTDMRARMARAKPPKRSLFHVKHDPGGLTDVEFLVQYALLAHAADHPALVHYSDHIRHLDALIDARIFGASTGEDLKAIYLAYRDHIHRRALDDRDVPVADARFEAQRSRVRGLWSELLG
ncbi:MAG: bifunctional [glutamate--ammonia ligase]-adenylyl-L-tyrosine phosphorylase/[glutamate--ammonia-ligase] adenylyltransferase [Pseudomonadota bacterium]